MIDVALRQRVVLEGGYNVREDIWEAIQHENSICADPFTVAAAFPSTSFAFCSCLRPFHFAVDFMNQHSLGCWAL